MTETIWLQSFDGDEMLAHVADRLTPRQWVLLAAAYVRRLWDWLPDGPPRQAIEAAESAVKPLTAAQRADWLRRIDTATPEAIGRAELTQRELVRSCDPDSADLTNPVLSRPNQVAPAFPLFRAASTHARNSITLMAEATGQAAQAIRALFAEPSAEMLDRVRERVEQAADTRTRANQAMNDARKLKDQGDELADRAASAKNKRIEESKALEIVRKVEEGRTRDGDDFEAEMRRDRAARKQLARLLREVIGNPFKEPRFEPAWRTSTVVELARGIFDDRAWDRLPILADALLDADCDEEVVLRHCRGTEIGAKEKPQHVRGCWVLELVLGRWAPLPAAPKGAKPRRRRTNLGDLDIGLPRDDDGTAFA